MSEGPDHTRDSGPSPDVNLDFPSVEDVTATDGRRGDLLGGYSHPLAAAEATPGRIYIPAQSGSVRSRGRVPDPLEVLPFGEDEGHTNEFGARAGYVVLVFFLIEFFLTSVGQG